MKLKDWQYHLINSGIAGSLVMLGSLSTVFAGDPTLKQICIGFMLGLITGTIVFMNKFNEWFKLQDSCNTKKIFQFV